MTPDPKGKKPHVVSTLPPAEWTPVSSSVNSRREADTRKYCALRGERKGIENIVVVAIKRPISPEVLSQRLVTYPAVSTSPLPRFLVPRASH